MVGVVWCVWRAVPTFLFAAVLLGRDPTSCFRKHFIGEFGI